MRDAAQMTQRTSRETLARMRYSELHDLAYQLTSELVAVAAFLTSDDKRVIGDRIRSLLGIEEKPARRTRSRAASEVPAPAPVQAPAPAEQPPQRVASKSADRDAWTTCPVCNAKVRVKNLRKHTRRTHGEVPAPKRPPAKPTIKKDPMRIVRCGDCGKEMPFAVYESHTCKKPYRSLFVSGGGPGLGRRR